MKNQVTNKKSAIVAFLFSTLLCLCVVVDGSPTLPISTNGACGPKEGTRCSGLCCSEWGFCGSSDDYCGKNCQTTYGDCDGSENPPSNPTPSPNVGGGCSPQRCGATWSDANTKCGPSCTSWTDPICGPGENCFGALATSLECCSGGKPEHEPSPEPTTPPTTHLTNPPTGLSTPPTFPPTPPSTSSPTPSPTDMPTPVPTDSPVAAPTPNPTNPPVILPTPEPTDVPVPVPPTATCSFCGFGTKGNGICEDESLCCSQWGWCGTSNGHCFGERTCGGGNRGNGVCSDPSLCCSAFGHCDLTSEHCGCSIDGSGPGQTGTPSPVTPTPPLSPGGDDSRLIAYVGNWQPCPTVDQWSQYTHIVIAFAVSYTWSPSKNICSTTCDIATPPVCNNQPNPSLIQEWQDAGKTVLVSFGGAGMGGSWTGDVNDCWDYCYGREQQVANRLVQIVNELGVDGVDIDYEYFYEDNQNFSGFNKGQEAQFFLEDVTRRLRQDLPVGSNVLTHSPMDADMVPGTAYYNVLKNQASDLNFLKPQYYNGITRPGQNFAGALSHYSTLVDDMFGGDSTKIVFGFCISDCSFTGSNLDGNQAASVITQLQTTYSCNGGAFFWVAQHDVGGTWSTAVSTAIGQNTCPLP